MLGFPLEVPFGNSTPAVRANDLNYYATVTDGGGPAMTWGMFAVGYIELGAGYEALAAANFNRSYANAQPPFLVWTETPSGGTPNFLTGAGGFLQTAFFGYTGLRINDTALTLNPALPEVTSKIGLRGIAYLGNRVDLRYDGAALVVTVQLPGPSPAPLAKREYAPACAAAGGEHRGCITPLGRAGVPAQPLSQRAQHGRVVLGGGVHVVVPQPLVLVDAAGAQHALTPGAPLQLPLQRVTILKA